MRRMKQLKQALPTQQPDACQHFWVIDGAGGPMSPGVCKRCGKTKDFFNSMDATMAGRDVLRLPKLGEVKVDEEEKEGK